MPLKHSQSPVIDVTSHEADDILAQDSRFTDEDIHKLQELQPEPYATREYGSEEVLKFPLTWEDLEEVNRMAVLFGVSPSQMTSKLLRLGLKEAQVQLRQWVLT